MWEQIRYNQTRSVILVAGMGAIWLLLGFVFGLLTSYFTPVNLFEGGIYGIIVSSILWIFIILFAYYFGDRILLAMAGARKIGAGDLHRILNIVDEMKIASGLEIMPSIYIIDDPALNAFAIGRDPNKAAVIVTTGLLAKLNRDELQGVIGHEIAHIKNRDVLLMSLCTTLLGTMNILTWLFSPKRLFASYGDLADEVLAFVLLVFGPGLVLAIILLILTLGIDSPVIVFILYIPAAMLLTPFLAKLIYFAISRRREYLADASSALYTRYPIGLASALEKIAASTNQLLAASPATAPIYIINPFRKKGMAASNLTRTHPPISERIRILRVMAHASYADYDRAYRQVHNVDKGIIPAAIIASASIVPMRAAISEDLDHIQRARETSNVLWNLSNYKLINCHCGTRMRLPPSFKYPEVKCPHCGKINPV
ncbi:MAG: M48 family metallopeptidase [Chloroflexota bacterium]|nr:MAG: M48 family metallopeptidase [Chloroflexota bacterium]